MRRTQIVPLAVPPKEAVAHAAANFSAVRGAPLRFRRGLDANSFFIESYDDPEDRAPARIVQVQARPERGGCRLEVSIPTDYSHYVLLAFVFLGSIPLMIKIAELGIEALVVVALVVPPLVLLGFTLAGSAAGSKSKEPRMIQDVVAVFEPIRRKGLAYREPAAALTPGAPE